MRKITLFSLILVSLVLAACAPAAEPAPAVEEEVTSEPMMEENHEADDELAIENTADDAAMPDQTPAADTPAWYAASMINANTGETFALTDFAGKVVLVETLAQWCSNCKRQQNEVKVLHELLGDNPDFVSVGLDIDPNESFEDLQAYTASNGFDWYYGIASLDTLREISDLYGDQFLNPPSTPILIIDRHGVAHPLPFGIKSAEDLLAFVTPYLEEGA